MSELSMEQRYDLICRAITRQDRDGEMAEILIRMEKTIKEELLKVTQRHSPPDFVSLFFDFQQEFERFREFSEFPDLSTKIVVGFGGGFSAGKSSLLNAIIEQGRLLPAEVDPTTTVPAYVIHGESESIGAINIFGKKLPLSKEEFKALTHDFERDYGTPLGHMMRSAHITLPDLPWKNLALLDTPGYSNTDEETENETTDARVARAQLNTAQFIVWIVRAESGTIPEKDLKFIATLRHEIPKLFVLSQADKKTEEDICSIIDLMKSTLSSRGISFLDVVPFSARKKNAYPATPITDHLDKWDKDPRQVLFAKNFKVLFSKFIRFLDTRKRDADRNLNRLNRILAITDDEDIRSDVQELQAKTSAEIAHIEHEREILHGLCNTFFRELKKVGDAIGIEMPEPSAVDLLGDDGAVLIDLLLEYRKKVKMKEQGFARLFTDLQKPEDCPNLEYILRRRASTFKNIILKSDMPGEPENMHHLLLRKGKLLKDILLKCSA